MAVRTSQLPVWRRLGVRFTVSSWVGGAPGETGVERGFPCLAQGTVVLAAGHKAVDSHIPHCTLSFCTSVCQVNADFSYQQKSGTGTVHWQLGPLLMARPSACVLGGVKCTCEGCTWPSLCTNAFCSKASPVQGPPLATVLFLTLAWSYWRGRKSHLFGLH